MDNIQIVSLFCPNCGHKLYGQKKENNTIRICCDRCGVIIFSKRKTFKEYSLKVIAK